MEFFVAILAGTVIFLLFSGFIIAYIMIYWKRKVTHAREVDKMKMLFNEELLKSQLAIKEETLNNISQEIHDDVGQTLSLAKLQLNIIQQGRAAENGALQELKDTLSHAMTTLRNIAKNLNTDNIQSTTLPQGIAQQVNQIARTGTVNIFMCIEGTERNINDHKKLILFRIMQESLQNIIKHSRARSVRIIFNYQSACLDITITDDGVGFDVNAMTKNADGLGLQNIVSRAALIGGKVNITSATDKGTSIQITTPYD
jgi:two-component system, NarL family, sensor kinase